MKIHNPHTTPKILPQPKGSKKTTQPSNFFNLPTSINFYSANKKIDYIYTASGQKTEQKTIDDGRVENRRQYAGSFVYKNRQLIYAASIAGRFVYVDDGRGSARFENEIALKDHLGNTRVTLDEHGNSTQQIDYYPFGHMIYASDTQTPFAEDNRFLYNGKEFQDDFGLDWYDYGARFYDAQIGRFHSVDPHAENYFHASAYGYVENNPISRIDPDGRDWFYYKAEGEEDASYHWQDGNTYEHTYSFTDAEGNEQTNTIELDGTEAAILFEGSMNESLSVDGKLTGEGAKPATVTVFGPRGKYDVQKYRGLTISSDPSKYPMIEEGQYEAKYFPMATSLYGDNKRTKERNIPGALTYLLSKEGNTNLPVVGGFNKATKKTYMSGGFIHRTNWGGKAKNASEGCLLIDGRQYRSFEKQLGKSMSISVTLRRNK